MLPCSGWQPEGLCKKLKLALAWPKVPSNARTAPQSGMSRYVLPLHLIAGALGATIRPCRPARSTALRWYRSPTPLARGTRHPDRGRRNLLPQPAGLGEDGVWGRWGAYPVRHRSCIPAATAAPPSPCTDRGHSFRTWVVHITFHHCWERNLRCTYVRMNGSRAHHSFGGNVDVRHHLRSADTRVPCVQRSVTGPCRRHCDARFWARATESSSQLQETWGFTLRHLGAPRMPCYFTRPPVP
ncbi:hypothetical protein F4780DRAFT_684671 [Xylariomycetidae sp. FL0641]|nr:hypothetical protein F4780DRAFT_684671 [Xylariomycetidae sp. FL0641]